jgi:hypothetical protein
MAEVWMVVEANNGQPTTASPQDSPASFRRK